MKTVNLTIKELKRFDVMQLVLRGEFKISNASELLEISLRQVY